MVAMQNYPNVPPAYNPQAQLPPAPQAPANPPQANTPEASGVKINIFNPQANSGSQNPQGQAPQHSLYNMPQSSVYGMPQGSVYAPQVPASAPAATPVQPQPVVNKIVPPAPAVDQQESEAIKLEQNPQGATAPGKKSQAESPKVNAAETQQAAKPQEKTGVDIQGLNTSLKSQNPDQQTDAIQKIAEIAQSNTPESNKLINEETFKGLTNIITKDTSKDQGPQKEKNELNKMIGLWSLAILQNNMRDQMNAEAKKQGIPSMPLKAIPGIPDVVTSIKSDPNPTVRAAGISAINFVAKPEDKEVVVPIYKQAMNDASPDVKEVAAQVLAKFEAPNAPQGSANPEPKAEAKQPEQKPQDKKEPAKA